MRPKTCDAARNKWKGVLLQLEVDKKHLTGKHAPCPMCGGKDRFRFLNSDGNGTWICNQCGSGAGMDLLMQVRGWDFRTAAQAVDQVLGNVQSDAPAKPALADDKRRQMLRELWKASQPIEADDPAGWYLESRVHGAKACADLHYAPAAPVPGGGTSPAMLAMVRDCKTGLPVTIHRTFLTIAGAKADMENPRAMMPGALPEAISVRLAEAGEVLGIAEGIETALDLTTRGQRASYYEDMGGRAQSLLRYEKSDTQILK
jgi:putative DNA primase/helicase